MKVLLLESVEGLGRPGDQVDVKEGHARNYLMPQRKAVRVTADNLRMLPYRGEEGETKTRVRTEVILNDGRVIPVDYSLRLNDGNWMAYDVTIEGISYLTNYRKEVGGLIKGNFFHDKFALQGNVFRQKERKES